MVHQARDRMTPFYCTGMTNLAVIGHHKICRCWNVILVTGHSKNCQKFTGGSLVTIKFAESLPACHWSPSGLLKVYLQGIGHHQICQGFASRSLGIVRSATSLPASYWSLSDLPPP